MTPVAVPMQPTEAWAVVHKDGGPWVRVDDSAKALNQWLDSGHYRLVRVLVTEGWRPIEEAPKDGTRVLVHRMERVEISHFDDDKYSKRPRPFWNSRFWGATRDRKDPPTHFMPLPAPPVERSAQGEG